MQIRKAKSEDLKQILQLYKQLNPTDNIPTDQNLISETWGEILKSPHVNCLVLEENYELISTCILSIIPNLSRGCSPYGLIENVVTEQQFRQKGFASELLKFALAEAWTRGCYKVMLLTGSKRQETLNFYEKIGFQPGKKTGFVAYPITLV